MNYLYVVLVKIVNYYELSLYRAFNIVNYYEFSLYRAAVTVSYYEIYLYRAGQYCQLLSIVI